MAKKGGYQMVNLATLTYALALAYLECGKPLLIYDGVNKPYYADSIEVDENENVVIRKGASSIVVASDDTKTFNNVLNGALFENIVDKDGNHRFIDGNITINETELLTQTYGKWSLSGTHLMFVVGFNVDNAVTISDGVLCKINIPQWIKDKIVNLFSIEVARLDFSLFGVDASIQSARAYLEKLSDDTIQIYMAGFTTTKARFARIQFELLIDNE